MVVALQVHLVLQQLLQPPVCQQVQQLHLRHALFEGAVVCEALDQRQPAQLLLFLHLLQHSSNRGMIAVPEAAYLQLTIFISPF